MRVVAIVTALVLLVGPQAHASDHRDSRWLKFGIVFNLGCVGADVWTTGLNLGAGSGREGNRVVAAMVDHPVGAGMFVLGTRASLMWLLLEQHERHPKLTTAAAWMSGATSCYIASRNARIYNRRQRP